jgi:galactokinase
MMYPLAQGVAVAVRPTTAAASRIACEGERGTWQFDRTEPAPAYPSGHLGTELAVVETLIRRLVPAEAQVEMSIIYTVPAECAEALIGAVAMATARALQACFALAHGTQDLVLVGQRCIAARAGRPFSIAYLLASDVGRPGSFVLVDTGLTEQLPLDAPSDNHLGMGLVLVDEPPTRAPIFYEQRQILLADALVRLQKRGFANLASFRDLDHQDLQHALGLLPRTARPFVSFVVKENHRVQKLVRSVRRRDWQLFGALLLMSHAVQRVEGEATSERVDFVVDQVEAMSLDGMYGACMSGSGGCVLVVGQPFVVPQCLDRVKAAYEAEYAVSPHVLLL